MKRSYVAILQSSRDPTNSESSRHAKAVPKYAEMRALAALLAAGATCPRSQLQGAPRTGGHEPWTHAAYCARAYEPGREPVCVFTDADFHRGQGISIVTRRDTAAKLVEEGLLGRPPRHGASADVPAVPKYEAAEREGSGIGLFVRPSEVIRAGERVLVDYPTFVNGQVGDSIPPDIRRYLQWKAMLQLPGETRRRSRDLAKSQGVFVDEIENVLGTNAFTHEKGGALHDVLFPEAAVGLVPVSSGEDTSVEILTRMNRESTTPVAQSKPPLSPGEGGRGEHSGNQKTVSSPAPTPRLWPWRSSLFAIFSRERKFSTRILTPPSSSVLGIVGTRSEASGISRAAALSAPGKASPHPTSVDGRLRRRSDT